MLCPCFLVRQASAKSSWDRPPLSLHPLAPPRHSSLSFLSLRVMATFSLCSLCPPASSEASPLTLLSRQHLTPRSSALSWTPFSGSSICLSSQLQPFILSIIYHIFLPVLSCLCRVYPPSVFYPSSIIHHPSAIVHLYHLVCILSNIRHPSIHPSATMCLSTSSTLCVSIYLSVRPSIHLSSVSTSFSPTTEVTTLRAEIAFLSGSWN